MCVRLFAGGERYSDDEDEWGKDDQSGDDKPEKDREGEPLCAVTINLSC